MIVVTGGAGFIGSAVVRALNQKGKGEILVVDNLSTTEKWKNLSGLEFDSYHHKSGFIGKLEAGGFGPIEAIVHLGACSSTQERDADYLLSNNTEYSIRLAKFAAGRGIRFVNASSAAVYGDGMEGFEEALLYELRPLNPYGFSKLLFDCWAHRSRVLDRIVSLRFFNVYGPGENHKGEMSSVVLKAFRQIQEGGAVSLFRSCRDGIDDGEQLRDFVYIDDCADLILWLLEEPKPWGVFNVGTGEARSFNDLARSVFFSAGEPEDIRYVEMPEELRKGYQYETKASLDGLQRAGCPIAFRSLEEGVAAYVAELQKEAGE